MEAIHIIHDKVMVKLLEQHHENIWGTGCKAPRTLALGRGVLSAHTIATLDPGKEHPVLTGEIPEPVWMWWKRENSPCFYQESNSGHPCFTYLS
jgi:hypothetical protein